MSADTAGRRHTIHRLALATAALLLATIGLSAFMRLTQAGLGCGDWPSCYAISFRLGSPTDPSDAVTAARLAHRVVASLALVLIISMTMLAWTMRPALPAPRRLLLSLLILVLALSALGVITPGARLPAVAMGNLLGGLASLALCARLIGATSSVRPHDDRVLRVWAKFGLTVLAAQLVLGALLSTSYAALSCTDFADCQRAAADGSWDWRGLSPWREPRFDFNTPHLNANGALTQWLHRVGAVAVASALVLVGVVAVRRGRARIGLVLIVLTGLQIMLGLAAVAGGLPLAVVLLHNLGAAAMLVLLVGLL